MRVLVACESSGVVREAFRRRGHEAWSCDLLPAQDGSPFHIQADANFVLNYPNRVLGGLPRWMREVRWDLLIAHPPCTYLCNSGVRWFTTIPQIQKPGTLYGDARRLAMADAAALFLAFLNAPIKHIAIENPIMHCHARQAIGGVKFSQTIQPWQFGHGEVKRTALWLRNLPTLVPTNIVSGRVARVHREPPSADRWQKRSVTYQGIADAMAEQWGIL